MDGGGWKAAVHGVAESRTRLSDFTFTFHFHALEKKMATHSSVLAWRIPGTGEPGGLPSMGSHRVRHDWSDLASAPAGYEVLPLCMGPAKLCINVSWQTWAFALPPKEDFWTLLRLFTALSLSVNHVLYYWNVRERTKNTMQRVY